jgi:hypothetical protein
MAPVEVCDVIEGDGEANGACRRVRLYLGGCPIDLICQTTTQVIGDQSDVVLVSKI